MKKEFKIISENEFDVIGLGSDCDCGDCVCSGGGGGGDEFVPDIGWWDTIRDCSCSSGDCHLSYTPMKGTPRE